jgi:hypothetical protein
MTEVVFCTTITPGYEREAVALAENLRQTDGEDVSLEVYVATASVESCEIAPSVKWMPGAEMWLDDDELCRIHSMLSGFEIACLTKARALYSTLLRNPTATAVYLDTDVVVLQPLTPIVRDVKGVGLSRHTSSLDPAAFPVFAHSGLFNAGVVACDQESADFALWWDELCSRAASHPNVASDFDQRFLDWVPSRWHVTDLTAVGVNVGPWNISEYVWTGGETPKISGTDVVLFHVSTLRSAVPSALPPEIALMVERYHSFREPIARSGTPRGRHVLRTFLRQRRRNRSAGRVRVVNRLADALRFSSVTFRESFGVPVARWGLPSLYRPLIDVALPDRSSAGVGD